MTDDGVNGRWLKKKSREHKCQPPAEKNLRYPENQVGDIWECTAAVTGGGRCGREFIIRDSQRDGMYMEERPRR